MKFGKRDHSDLNIYPKQHLKNVLYTTRPNKTAKKDLWKLPLKGLMDQKPKQKKADTQAKTFASKARRIHCPMWLRTGWDKVCHVFHSLKAKWFPVSEAKDPYVHEKPEDNRKFFAITGACAAFLILCAILLPSFILPQERTVTLNDSGRIIEAKTTCETVGEFLEENDVTVSDEDYIEVSTAAPVEEGMEIVIRRAMPLTIVQGDDTYEVKMIAGTVQDAIELSGLDIGADDEVYPSVDTYIKPSMTINLIEVDVEYVTEQEKLYFKEVTKNDDTLAKGKTKVVQSGKDGLQENKIKVVYKNGTEVSRELVSTEVVSEPVDQITHIGTYVEVKQEEKPANTNKDSNKNNNSKDTNKDSNKNNTNKDKEYSIDINGEMDEVPKTSDIYSDTLYDHKNQPKPSASIIKKAVVIDQVTAYTHTGNRTATGTWPKIGTVAADPEFLSYGTKIYVPGYGYGRIEDTGGFRHADHTQLDLFMETKKECLNWGRKRNLKIYILK